jgi:hypothetical protein
MTQVVMSIRVTCISKSGGYHADPHHAISHLGWVNEQTGETGQSTRLAVYEWIKDQSGIAYVQNTNGDRARVGTREHGNGTKYLQTHADQVWTDNLLALPECR